MLSGILYFVLTAHYPEYLIGSRGEPVHMREGYSIKEAMHNEPAIHQVKVLLNKGLAFNVDDRFKSAEELRARIDELRPGNAGAGELDVTTALQEARADLLRFDHKSKIRAHIAVSKRLLSSLHAIVAEYAQLADPFELRTFNKGLTELPFPTVIDPVGDHGTTVKLSLPAHNIVCEATYAVGWENGQCVLLRFECGPQIEPPSGGFFGGPPSDVPHFGVPASVLWFDSNSPPHADAVVKEIKGWIIHAIEELLATVKQASQATLADDENSEPGTT